MATEKININRVTQLVYWVIGAIALAGVVFMFWPKEDTHTQLRGNLKLSSDSMVVVNHYLEWADEASKSDMNVNHGFVSTGLSKMADALKVLSTKVSRKMGDDSKARIDTIKEMSDLLIKDSKSSQHADMIKKAFTASGEVLTSVQTYSFPELENEIEILNEKISEIESEKPTLEQKPEIVQSFQQVAVLLKKMTDDENKNLE
ncbi:hypothetical protein WG906_12470 [Pedobacter sp. P351]|uniref:hypothetical protein n=1 Tax=Pedobacter superstes TaxID=3133441 RepID=UPI0030B74EEB